MFSRISENYFYLLAFALALGIRLLNLGAPPLSDSEAQWAMQALELGRGASEIGAQPGYVMLTGLLFHLTHATDALARLLPAILGSLVVFFPALLRAAGNRLNFPRTAAIWLAFGLALDPTLAVTARQVGSSATAVTCLVLALAAIYARRPIVAGVLGGLALLSGPATLQGALGLALAYGLLTLLEKADWLAPLNVESEALPPVKEEPAVARTHLRHGLYAAGATILIAGTLFLAYPLGLSGLAASLTSFLNGWVVVSAISPSTPLAALAIYETLPLLLGLSGSVLGWLRRDPLAQRLSLWLLAALLLTVIYPARQVGDLAWALIPLWSLAVLALVQLFQPSEAEEPLRWIAMLHAIFLFILLVVLRLNLLAWQNYGIEQGVMLMLSIGVIAMGIIATLMVVIGWSARLARDGVLWAVTGVTTLTLLAATFWGTQARPDGSYELWQTLPAAGQVELFTKTLQHLSVTHSGLQQSIDIVSTVDTPSMRWALRDYANARFVAQLTVTEQPSVAITWQDQAELQSSGSYRGQDFAWAIYPGWQGALPPAWLPWTAFRKAPMVSSAIILWAHSDLFSTVVTEE